MVGKKGNRSQLSHVNVILAHLLTSLFLIVSVSLITYVYLGTAPLHSDTFTTDKSGNQAWLVKVNATASAVEYGFAVWGWCSWDGAQKDAFAQCHRGIFWGVSNDTAGMQGLGLPGVVGTSLGPSAFFLFIPFMCILLFTFSHLLVIRYPAKGQVPLRNPGGIPQSSKEAGSKRLLLAYRVRSLWTGLAVLGLSFVGCLPTFICVGAGVGASNPERKIKPGLGTGLLAGSLVLLLAALVLIWTAGLWYNNEAEFELESARKSTKVRS